MNAEGRKVARFVRGLQVGQRCNVRSGVVGNPNDKPMIREITFAGTESRKDGEWIVWRWKPESVTPEGRMDCGYSGYRISATQVSA